MPHIESFLWGRSHLSPEDLKADIERDKQAAEQAAREIAENELKIAELELLRQGLNETLHLDIPQEWDDRCEEEEYEEPVRHRSYDYDR